MGSFGFLAITWLLSNNYSRMHHPTSPTELIIRPSSGWQLLNWRELVQYRDLLYFLTIRGIKPKSIFYSRFV
jgi:hypothetical protein